LIWLDRGEMTMPTAKTPFKNPLSMQIDPDLFKPATEEEKAQQIQTRESVSFAKDALRRLGHNRLAMVCIVIIVLIALIAFIAPEFYPYTYTKQDVTAKYLQPFQYSVKEQAKIAKGVSVFPHVMGTDALGRDYAIRVIYGTRISLLVGIFSALIVVVVGIIYGSISGYFGGRVDNIMMRIVDIIYALPDVLLVILLSVAIKDIVGTSKNELITKLGSGMVSIFIVFGLLYWVGMARQVRGQILSIKEQEYVLASRSIGASPARIIRKHMIPNCVSVIIIVAAMQIPSAIFTESFLSFLGMGVSIPMPSLGSLAADARAGLNSYPFLLIYPAMSIFLIVLSFNLLGNGLRDAFDPKLRS
jgi:oligopeptide transport system permease protein